MRTRDRLLACSVRLIAERGYDQVGVGEIEEAAGLVPRRGGMYRHFASKEALIEAALAERVAALASMASIADEAIAQASSAGLRSAAASVLTELDQERDLIAIFERDGDRFPAARDRFYDEVVEVGSAHAVRSLREIAAQVGSDVDADALAKVALSALVNHRRQAWTFGRADDDDEFLDAWAGVVWTAMT